MDRHQIEATLNECVNKGYCAKWEHQSWHHRYSLTDKDENYFYLDASDALSFDKDDLTQIVKDMFLIDDEPKPSIKSGKAIFVSTPSGENHWKDLMENKQGLYYRVKSKLEKLHRKMEHPIGPIGRILEGIMIKFERDNKISADDMKTCNELWKKYGNK